MKLKNIAFIPVSSESSSQLRAELLRLGLSFFAVRVNGESTLMITTNDLRLIKKLAKISRCDKIYLSDCYRTLVEVSIIGNKFIPIKLGTLKRSLSQNSSSVKTGGFSLIVNEDCKDYFYVAE